APRPSPGWRGPPARAGRGRRLAPYNNSLREPVSLCSQRTTGRPRRSKCWTRRPGPGVRRVGGGLPRPREVSRSCFAPGGPSRYNAQGGEDGTTGFPVRTLRHVEQAMAHPFAEVFARRGPAETRKAHEELSRTLDEACRNLAGTLAACPPALRQDLLAVITPRV